MKVILTLRLIENLQRLADADAVPYSSLPKTLAESLVKEGLLNVVNHGSRRSLRTHNIQAFLGALPRYNEALTDLEAAKALLTFDGTRSAQASLSGNSKILSERTCPGFLINCYDVLECRLRDKPFTVNPPEGSAVYIADWTTFIPPSRALIIGVENMENFLKIRSQKDFFSGCLKSGETDILFVARYAFSSDMAHWLARLPNRYVHFGDFDLAGIDIYLSQYLPHVGQRGSFLIPDDIELRISNGSRKRYDDQYRKYSALTSDDARLRQLISIIHKYRRTYDQEGYIKI